MPRTSIEIEFNIDIKSGLFQSAWAHAFREAPERLNTLFKDATHTQTEIICPQYKITYSLKG